MASGGRLGRARAARGRHGVRGAGAGGLDRARVRCGRGSPRSSRLWPRSARRPGGRAAAEAEPSGRADRVARAPAQQPPRPPYQGAPRALLPCSCRVDDALDTAGGLPRGGPPRSARRSPAAASARALKGIWGPTVERGVSQFPVYRDLGIQLVEMRLEWAQAARVQAGPPAGPGRPGLPVAGGGEHGGRGERGHRHPRCAAANRLSGMGQRREDPELGASASPGLRRLRLRRGPPVSDGPAVDGLGGADASRGLPADRPGRPGQAVERGPDGRRRTGTRGLLDAAYGALKAASRRNLVIGGMTFTTGEVTTRQWIENLRLPNGRAPRLDLYGHNPFSAAGPEPREPGVGGRERRLLGSRPAGRLDRSVSGPGPAIDQALPLGVDDPDGGRRRVQLLRRARRSRPSGSPTGCGSPGAGSRVYAIGWIHLYDDLPSTAGGLLDAQGNKKPGYEAWRNG